MMSLTKSPNRTPVCNSIILMMIMILMQFDGASGVIDTAVEGPRFQEARQKWESKRGNMGYIFYETLDCNYDRCVAVGIPPQSCTDLCQRVPYSYGEMKVHVDASGTVISIQNFLGVELDPTAVYYNSYYTVETLFRTIETAIYDSTFTNITVEYHPGLGFPTYYNFIEDWTAGSFAWIIKFRSLCLVCDDS